MRNLFSMLFGLAIAAPGLAPVALADDANTAYVVTYFESVPGYTGQVRNLMRDLARASRKEPGHIRMELLQRIGQPDQFVILEAWQDKDTHAAHMGAAHTKQFREKLQPLLRGPFDERPHTNLSVGAAKVSLGGGDARATTIYGVTHVDIVPKEKDTGVGLVKQLSGTSRKDAGNLRFDALTQNSRPNHMTIVEIWADKKTFEEHGITAHKRQFREKLMPLSGSLYDERLYRIIN
jgi:quinol monooxygenase YgiN